MDFEYEIINIKERIDNLQESFLKAQMNNASITSRMDEALSKVEDLVFRMETLEGRKDGETE